jgi:hypothetical protein
MPDAGEEILAFPDTQARRLAGVSTSSAESIATVMPDVYTPPACPFAIRQTPDALYRIPAQR